jgi:hypothetical protein
VLKSIERSRTKYVRFHFHPPTSFSAA